MITVLSKETQVPGNRLVGPGFRIWNMGCRTLGKGACAMDINTRFSPDEFLFFCKLGKRKVFGSKDLECVLFCRIV